MPTYEYVCTACGAPLEVVQSIHDPALTECPACDGGQLRKVYGNVGVVFKGSGFYRTDSRSRASADAPSKKAGAPGGASTAAAGAPAPKPAAGAAPKAPQKPSGTAASP